MKNNLKIVLPLILMAMVLTTAFSTQAKTRKNQRTVYYIVCGSYQSLSEAIEHADEMSEVLFYNVYKASVKGRTTYRVCCQCYYSKADAQKDLDGILSSFKGDDWWIWPSKGLAKCVYRPLSPKDGEGRIPDLKPLKKAITE